MTLPRPQDTLRICDGTCFPFAEAAQVGARTIDPLAMFVPMSRCYFAVQQTDARRCSSSIFANGLSRRSRHTGINVDSLQSINMCMLFAITYHPFIVYPLIRPLFASHYGELVLSVLFRPLCRHTPYEAVAFGPTGEEPTSWPSNAILYRQRCPVPQSLPLFQVSFLFILGWTTSYHLSRFVEWAKTYGDVFSVRAAFLCRSFTRETYFNLA